MCVSKPKAPKVTPIPDRRASVLPDGGDPSVALNKRKRNRMASAHPNIFTDQGTLGASVVASPSNTG